MKNIYHPDIYKFEKPVNSYWEDTTKENFNLEKLVKDINNHVQYFLMVSDIGLEIKKVNKQD